MCAERNLIARAVLDAERHGVPKESVVCWVRRKYGHHISVLRRLSDGTVSTSYPCSVCRETIVRFGLTVHACAPNGEPFHGCMNDVAAPSSKYSSGFCLRLRRKLE
jgi:cytidine deaminase